MRGQKTLFMLLALTCLLLTFPASSGQASQCRYREDDLLEADVIFSGKVIRVERNVRGQYENLVWHDEIVTFQVQNAWKGNFQTQAVVLGGEATGRDCGIGNCGYGFKQGVSYLVFAYDWQRDSARILMADKCSRTAPLSSSGARHDLAALGPGHLPDGGSPTDEGIGMPFVIAIMLALLGLSLRWVGRANSARKQNY